MIQDKDAGHGASGLAMIKFMAFSDSVGGTLQFGGQADRSRGNILS